MQLSRQLFKRKVAAAVPPPPSVAASPAPAPAPVPAVARPPAPVPPPEDPTVVAVLEKRVDWLETERLRLLQLSRNGSSRSLASASSSQSQSSRSSAKQKQVEKHFQVPIVHDHAENSTNDSENNGNSENSENSENSANSENSGGSNGSINSQQHLAKKTTTGNLAAAVLGVVVVMEPGAGLVVTEFVRDARTGEARALEASGRVCVGDRVVGVDGHKAGSGAELERLLCQLHGDGELDMARRLADQREAPSDLPGALEAMEYLESELKFARDEYARLDIGALEGLESLLDDSRRHAMALEAELATLNEMKSEWFKDVDLARKYEKKEKECRRLLNALIDLKGAIRVFVRVRPGEQRPDVHASFDDHRQVLSFPEERVISLSDLQSPDVPERSWDFDAVFDPAASQKQVYCEVEPLVYSVVDGYNACVFAFGQTGSGKTYTMDGPEDDRGVYYRATATLFEAMEKRRKETPEAERVEFDVKVSVLEIYQERVRDLLEGATHDKHSLEIMHHPKSGYVYVQGAEERSVTCAEELHAVLDHGKRHRVVGITDMNERSSRSHMVLLVSVVTKVFSRLNDGALKCKTRAKLQLIDLAGSERADDLGPGSGTGQRLKETCYINKSLSALGDVMHALQNQDQTPNKHIPFRNSKLTSLLRDSLGGKAKTLMMIQVNPLKRHMHETLRTLEFAQRVGKICLAGSDSKRGSAADRQHVAKLKRDNAEQASELLNVRQRVVGIKQGLDAEKHAHQSLLTAHKTLQAQLDVDALTLQRTKRDHEIHANNLQRQLKELSRKQNGDSRAREECDVKRSQQQSSVAQAELKQLRARNAELRRRLLDSQQRVDGLEKAAQLSKRRLITRQPSSGMM